MSTIRRIEHETTASKIESITIAESPLRSSSFSDYGEGFTTLNFENKNIAELNQYPSESLWNTAGGQFNPSCPLEAEVDTIYGTTVIHGTTVIQFKNDYRHKDSHLRLLFLKPYPKTTVLANNSTLLIEMLSEIDNLLKNEYDWDEIDYRKPTPEDIDRAKLVLTEFVFIMNYGEYSLQKPHISNSEDGGAKIEWHSDKRSLYLRIDRLESIATKIQDEPDGTTTVDTKSFRQQDYLSLWKWISNE